MKYILILLLSISYLNAKDLIYTKQNIHAFLPPNNDVSFSIEGQLMNDTVDLLNIKEQELGSSAAASNIGDMQGLELNIGYSFFDDFYINATLGHKTIQYADTDLVNTNLDIYLRYQIYQNSKTAYAIDGGFSMNKADELTFTDINFINKFLKDYPAYYAPDGTFIYQDGTGGEFTYNDNPYITLQEYKDSSFYIRGIVSFKTRESLYDIFAGYKYTNINIATDISLAHASEQKIIDEYNKVKDKLPSSRTESMLFAGANIVTQFGSFFTELSYKYNKMLRAGDLSGYDSNHIIDVNLVYALSNQLAIYAGGKVMTNQFNGEINYLYTNVTKSSFDKKYGYARTGLMFRF